MRGVKHDFVRVSMHPERLTPMFEPANIQGKRQQVLGNWVELDEGRGHGGPAEAGLSLAVLTFVTKASACEYTASNSELV